MRDFGIRLYEKDFHEVFCSWKSTGDFSPVLQIVDKVTSNEKIRSHFVFFELRT